MADAHPKKFEALKDHNYKYMKHHAERQKLALSLEPKLGVPTLEKLLDHFEHVVKVGGTGAACLGSDYDGVPEMPEGHEDVTKLPALLDGLKARGLPHKAIAGQNVLRILEANEAELEVAL